MVRRLKYEMCKNWREKGSCKYGDKCLFAHGTSELTKRSTVNGPEPAKPVAEVKPAQAESKEAAVASEDSKSASDKSLNENAKDGKQLIELTDSKILTAFETPAKADSPTEIATPAFSSQQEMST